MSEWEQKPLGKFISFQRGHDLARSEMKQGNIPVAGSNGIIGYHERPTTTAPGLTIGRSGNIGTPRFYKEDFWAHNTVLYVKDFYGNDPLFSYYLLMNIDFSGFNSGSAVPSLNRNHIHEHLIRTPSLAEQKAIASVLASIDDKIDLLNRQNKTLGSMAETLFRQWFIEEAQKDWPEKNLNQYVELNKSSISKKYDFKEIQYLDTGSLTKGKISELQTILLSEAPSRAKRLVNNFDILLSTVRPDQCHYGICINPPSNLVVSTGFCVISSKSISPFFIYYLLTSEDMTEYLHSIAEGSTSTYPSLKPEDIGNVTFLYPGEEKLKSFHKLVGSYWKKIHNNHKKIQPLETLRDTLLPKLMSGEVRVQYAEEAIASVA